MVPTSLRRLTLVAALLGGTWLAATPALSQDALPATLVADQVSFDAGAATLVAEGNVEIFQDGRILRAKRITYDRTTNDILIEGPLYLIDSSGAVLIADEAALSPDLRAGVLRSARLVLDRKLQLAATEISRGPAGRYTQMYQTVASSCTVCANQPVPLWQIRAKRVIHDAQEQQLYFEQARFEVAGVPIAYLPQLRLPDPTLERSSGFLIPDIVSSDQLGTGVKVPYFFVLGDHADLTLTPYVTVDGTQTLETRYRQAFVRGEIEVNGAVSSDDLTAKSQRGYLFAEGAFDLNRGYKLDFDIEATSDPDYMLSYGYSEKDRLDSRLAVSKVTRDSFFEAEVIAFQSLRTADDNRFLPTLMAGVTKTERFEPAAIGGVATWTLEAHGHYRTGDAPAIGTSRDVARASASANWRRSWIWESGLVTSIQGELHADAYNISDDPAFANDVTRVTPYLGFEARLPMTYTAPSGATHVLEPVLQAFFAPDRRELVPNEDSLTGEFDEGNLFSASRFAGRDGRELGNRLNIGVSWTRFDPAGWHLGLTVGRVIRDRDLVQFNPGTGLDGNASDWLLGLNLGLSENFSLMQRAVFDDQFSFAKSETLLTWTGPNHSLESGYTWLQADPAAGRPVDTSEWALDASYGLGGDWTGSVDWRYDFVTNDATRAGLGLTYHSDCVKVDFSVTRRFTSTATLRPSTNFGISIGLAGFGAQGLGTGKGRRICGV